MHLAQPCWGQQIRCCSLGEGACPALRCPALRCAALPCPALPCPALPRPRGLSSRVRSIDPQLQRTTGPLFCSPPRLSPPALASHGLHLIPIRYQGRKHASVSLARLAHTTTCSRTCMESKCGHYWSSPLDLASEPLLVPAEISAPTPAC